MKNSKPAVKKISGNIPKKKDTESLPLKKKRARKLVSLLKKIYPDVKIALDFGSPFELLVATVLSAQCTDARVNMVTPQLFRRFRSPKDFAGANVIELEYLIKSTGFYHNKARSIIGCSRKLVERFGGVVPHTMEELLSLDGVGRKTANVVLGNAFGVPGIAVDTHVGRLAQRLGFSHETDPAKIESDLMKVFPSKDWSLLCHLLMSHGRAVCKSQRPDCAACKVKDLCPSAFKVSSQKRKRS